MLSSHKTLHQAFLQQAEITPEHTCLIDEQFSLTYSNVQQAVYYFAHTLQLSGVKTGTVVGLFSGKRVELIIGFLAVSLLGGKCVQLDKAFPEKFLVDVLKETYTEILLCDENISIQTPLPIKYIDIARLYRSAFSNTFEFDLQTNAVSEKNVVWLVYSSGTTGAHKGIAITHKAILASYDMRSQVIDYDSKSRVGCSIYYLWEVFRPILKGGTTYIVNDNILHDFDRLTRFIQHHNINEFLFTPSYLETMLYSDPEAADKIFSQIQTCWLNGEVVSSTLYHHLIPYMKQMNIYNLYSISECHDVAVYKLTERDIIFDDEGVLPVGYLLEGVESVLLNEQGKICKPGQRGELYIHSPGLAEGYINRVELNKERFMSDDISPIGKRLYKTGDLARLNKNQRLIIIYGRCDYFVRLRGYNISLPFIEETLKGKLDLAHCVVTKQGASNATEYIAAYLEVPIEKQSDFRDKWQIFDNSTSSHKLINYVASHVPNYMVPQVFNIVSVITINPYSNKLDRTSLAKENRFDFSKVNKIKHIEDYRELWAMILNVETQNISSNDGFFDSGGSSLSAMVLLSQAVKLGLNKISIKNFIAQNTLLGSYTIFTNEYLYHDQESNNIALNDVEECYRSLRDSIITHSKLKEVVIQHHKTCLMIGVTGFLGAHILQQLLADTDDDIICIIRDSSEINAYQRFENIVITLGLNKEIIKCRVKVYRGDITLYKLGLPGDDWHQLSRQTNYVINAAANVNLVLPYSSLKAVCVEGVKNLIELCLAQHIKPFYQVSTNGIFPDKLSNFTEEGSINSYLSDLKTGYSQAKWASENLLRKMRPLGLPVTFFRPGNIFAEHINNVNNSDMNWLILQSIVSSGYIPDDLVLEMTNVTQVSKVISYVVNHEIKNKCINMTNPKYLTAETLSEYSGIKIISKTEWVKLLKDSRLICLLDHYDNWLDSSATYEQKNYEQIMSEMNIDYPDLLANHLLKAVFNGQFEK
ncbi:MAG: thioester reductase-like protein [Francisellaceae bacterium]|jgi:thioester reductase-like protein